MVMRAPELRGGSVRLTEWACARAKRQGGGREGGKGGGGEAASALQCERAKGHEGEEQVCERAGAARMLRSRARVVWLGADGAAGRGLPSRCVR